MELNYKNIIEEAWEEYQKNKKYPNVVLLGCTGSGKSSLINDIFNQELAKINDVTPETKEFKIYYGKNIGKNINLIDSMGYELSNNSTTYINNLKHQIEKLKKNSDKIHLVWFCLSVTKKRIEEIDLKILEEVLKIEDFRKRICVIITKCDEDDVNGSIASSYKRILYERYNEIKIFEVTTNRDCYVEELEKQKHKMLEWSAKTLDSEELRESFIAGQIRNLELKKKEVEKIINETVLEAGIVGAAPIPFSDAIILVPLQTRMIIKIQNIYNLNDIFSKISKSGGVILENIGKNLTKTLVSNTIGNALKFIPGIGMYVGGVINAGVASSLTYALGKSISEISYHTANKILNGENVNIEEVFSENSIIGLAKKFF